jgi:hypothetical protein
VVDEEDVKQIKPLPNLFYKIVTGNSLLNVRKTILNETVFRELETLKPLYFDETHAERKHQLKLTMDSSIHKLTNGMESSTSAGLKHIFCE